MDSTKLQQDLTALEDWESKWQMSFRPEKCTVLRITTNKGYRRETNYFLHSQRLLVADSANYFRVTLRDDLQWEKHTQATAAKVSRTLGFLRRNLKDCSKQHTSPWSVQKWSMLLHPGIHTRQRMLTTLTKSSPALHVMLATSNNYTERTQGCVTAMVNSLGLETLQDRRKIQRLTMLFKIKHNLVEIPEAESFVWSNDSRRRGSPRLFVPYTRMTVYKKSFFPRTIQDWNKLPSSVTDMQDIKAFKTALHARIAVQPPVHSKTSHGCV